MNCIVDFVLRGWHQERDQSDTEFTDINYVECAIYDFLAILS